MIATASKPITFPWGAEMKFDTVEKAKRILPSFAMRLADGISDIHVLRHRVNLERGNLHGAHLEKAGRDGKRITHRRDHGD